MDKNLVTINQNATLALSKAKELLRTCKSITNKYVDIIKFKDNIQTWKDKDTNLIWEVKSSANEFEKRYNLEASKNKVLTE